MIEEQRKEAAVQSLIALALELKPWTEAFKQQGAMVLEGYAKQLAPGQPDGIDLLLAAYLRAYGVRFGKQSAAELGKLLKDIQRANECVSGKTGTPKRKVGRPSSKTKRADA